MNSMNTEVLLAGIDLAWQATKNPSAVALGKLAGNTLALTRLKPALYGIENIRTVLAEERLHGLAVDAPLIINNLTGQRPCEKALSANYRSRFAGCHPSNQTLYPNALSVQLANQLSRIGFQHLGSADRPWQIECYPHPSIVEMFGLPERHKYKKGTVAERRFGQIQLAMMIKSLAKSSILKLVLPDDVLKLLDEHYIAGLSAQSLKSNEDGLDAVICLYIAGLYQERANSLVYGDTIDGYIWVPTVQVANINAHIMPHTKLDSVAIKPKRPKPSKVVITEDFRNGTTQTTTIGYINKNQQVVMGTRGIPGTDHRAKAYKLECLNSSCGYLYGANGTDIFLRKCPACQGGRPGIQY
jgi:predicted RNase H-like nuclease